jgi:hypothetical protein
MKNFTIAFLAAASLFTVGACKKKGGGDAGEALAKMKEFKDQMCKCADKACADKVQADMGKWSEAMAKTAEKDQKPDEATMKEMTAVGDEYSKCMAKAMGAGDAGSAAPTEGSAAPAAGSAAAAPAGDLPAECQEYKAAIDKLAACDKLPQQTRDALKQSYEQTSAAWASVPAEGRASLATACKSAAEAVKQSSAACQ